MLEALLAYAKLSREISRRTRLDYIETLTTRLRTYCDCAIRQQVGVEVMIFRGNNRVTHSSAPRCTSSCPC
jgi:hypothetical protein